MTTESSVQGTVREPGLTDRAGGRFAPGRVVVICPTGNVDSIPSLCSLIILLARRGYGVDLLVEEWPGHVRPCFDEDGIVVFSRTGRRGSPWPVPWKGLPAAVAERLFFAYRHRRCPYVCVLAVNPGGVVEAERFVNALKVPLVYFSLELMLSSESLTPEHRALKEKERTMAQTALLCLIQNEEKAQLFAQDNGVPRERIVCLPNAPLGKAARGHSDFLRRRLGISPADRIILHAGSLETWTGILPLARSVAQWPSNWVLVCHSRGSKGGGVDRNHMDALAYLARPGRVQFSTNPVSRAEYLELIRSADVGVAFYQEDARGIATQTNVRCMGVSSGKLAYYLQAGLPVLVNNLPSMRVLVDAYGCGCVADDPEVTRPGLDTLFSRYDEFSRNAVRCFEHEFAVEPAIDRLQAALEAERQKGAP